MRSGVDFELYPEAVDPSILVALRAGLVGATSHEATVRAAGEDQVVHRIRRTRRVAVADGLTELAQRGFADLRPRLEARFSVGLGACETPQFLRYERGDRFAAHQDSSSDPADGDSPARRRVSAVLLLGSDAGPAAGGRRGGVLTFFDTSATATWQTCRVPVDAAAGSVIAFPSDLVHEVTPVRSGTRLSVVTWFHAAS